MMKLLGCIMIVAATTATGFDLALGVRRTSSQLHQFLRSLELMEWEIRCRMTPLPQLCKHLENACRGTAARFYAAVERELEHADLAGDAFRRAIAACTGLDAGAAAVLQELGDTFGALDLEGQCAAVASAKVRLQRQSQLLDAEKNRKCKSYELLGLCSGLALAIMMV